MRRVVARGTKRRAELLLRAQICSIFMKKVFRLYDDNKNNNSTVITVTYYIRFKCVSSVNYQPFFPVFFRPLYSPYLERTRFVVLASSSVRFPFEIARSRRRIESRALRTSKFGP